MKFKRVFAACAAVVCTTGSLAIGSATGTQQYPGSPPLSPQNIPDQNLTDESPSHIPWKPRAVELRESKAADPSIGKTRDDIKTLSLPVSKTGEKVQDGPGLGRTAKSVKTRHFDDTNKYQVPEGQLNLTDADIKTQPSALYNPDTNLASVGVTPKGLTEIVSTLEVRLQTKLNFEKPPQTLGDLMKASQMALNSKLSPEAKSAVLNSVKEVLTESINDSTDLRAIGIKSNTLNRYRSDIQKQFNVRLQPRDIKDEYKTVGDLLSDVRNAITRTYGTREYNTLVLQVQSFVMMKIKDDRWKSVNKDSNLYSMGLNSSELRQVKDRVGAILGINISHDNTSETVGDLMSAVQNILSEKKSKNFEITGEVKDMVTNAIKQNRKDRYQSPVMQYFARTIGLGDGDIIEKDDFLRIQNNTIYFGRQGEPEARVVAIKDLNGKDLPGAILGFTQDYIYLKDGDSDSSIRIFDVQSREVSSAIPLGGNMSGFAAWGSTFTVAVQRVGIVTFYDENKGSSTTKKIGQNQFLADAVKISATGGLLISEKAGVYRTAFYDGDPAVKLNTGNSDFLRGCRVSLDSVSFRERLRGHANSVVNAIRGMKISIPQEPTF